MLMRMILSVIILLFITSENIHSQSSATSHALQLQFEVLGAGASSSFNIDSRLGKRDNGIGFGQGSESLRLGG